jgi:hypothetical protein
VKDFMVGQSVEYFKNGVWWPGRVSRVDIGEVAITMLAMPGKPAAIVKPLNQHGQTSEVRLPSNIGGTVATTQSASWEGAYVNPEDLIVVNARRCAALKQEMADADAAYNSALAAAEEARLKRNEVDAKRRHAVRELCHLLGIVEAS